MRMEKFSSHRVRQYGIGIAIAIIVFILASCVRATTPNPGQDYTEVGGGISQGDLMYGSATDTLSVLSKDINAKRYLSNTGTNNNPLWSLVNLATGVTGNLSINNFDSGFNAGAGSFLRGDGTWVSPSGALINVTFYNSGTGMQYTFNGTYIVELVGGGGAGGGYSRPGSGSGNTAGGGGAGGYAKFVCTTNGIETLTVGAGGTGTNGTGGLGGTTSMTCNGSTISALGGSGGVAGTAGSTTPGVGAGGAGGGTTGAYIGVDGGPGMYGTRESATVSAGGAGGDSVFGGGADGNICSSTANPGNNADAAAFGAGGSGACSGTRTAEVGGNGASGIIIITSYTP